MKVSWRPYAPGDEAAINQLYREVTGRQRTNAEWAWQWQQAPGGIGRIFLIEAEEGDETRLIGHHGIMPIRFSFHGEPLLFGKTENTMVLPAYRNRILYPRFESKFQGAYEPDLDALFSTMGPDAAIRLRLALGYQLTTEWVSLTLFAGAGAGWEFLRHRTHKASDHGRAFANLKSACGSSAESRGGRLRLFSAITDPDVSLIEAFCNRFSSGRVEPARTVADLAWRYWDNPHIAAITFLVDHATRGGAVVTVTCKPRSAIAWVDDVVTETGSVDELVGAIDAVVSFVHERTGICIYQFSTTSDYGDERLASLRAMSRAGWGFLLNRFRRESPAKMMPRKITERGKVRGLVDVAWGVTPIVFQGV